MSAFYRDSMVGMMLAGAVAVAPPAAAQENAKAAAMAADRALAAKDLATAERQLDIGDAAATDGAVKATLSMLRLNLLSGKLAAQARADPNKPVDRSVLVKPLDALLANPAAPTNLLPQLNYLRGTIADDAGRSAEALPYLERARSLGSTAADLDTRIAQAKVRGGDIKAGLADLELGAKRLPAGSKQLEALYRFGLMRAFQAKLAPETLAWSVRLVRAYPSAENWAHVTDAILAWEGSPIRLEARQRIDAWRLKRATGALRDTNDYFEAALELELKSLPAEAASLLEEGFATGRLKDNPRASSMLAGSRQSMPRYAVTDVELAKAATSENGRMAASIGDQYIAERRYDRAIEMYRTALRKGSVDNSEVQLHLGIALTLAKQKAAAQSAFKAVTWGPNAYLATLWSAYAEQ